MPRNAGLSNFSEQIPPCILIIAQKTPSVTCSIPTHLSIPAGPFKQGDFQGGKFTVYFINSSVKQEKMNWTLHPISIGQDGFYRPGSPNEVIIDLGPEIGKKLGIICDALLPPVYQGRGSPPVHQSDPKLRQNGQK